MFKNVTMLVSTSRAYESFLPNFIKCFTKYFSSFNGPIKTNIANCKYLNGIKKIRNDDFSSRTLQAIKEIDTDYIILMLDDYYLMNYVNINFLKDALSLIKKDNVGRVIFCDRNPSYQMGTKIVSKYFIKCYQRAPFIISAQPSIWKKNYLINCLRKGENAWQFEVYGSYRKHNSKKWDIYYPKEEYHLSLFPYPIGGIYVHGKLTEEGKKVLLQENLNEPIIDQSKNIYKKHFLQRLFDTNLYGHIYIRLSRIFRFIKCRSQYMIAYSVKDNWRLRDKNLYHTISE